VRNNTTYLLALFIVFSALLGGGGPRPGSVGPAGAQQKEQPNQPTSDPFKFSPCVVDESDDPLEQCEKCPLFCPARELLDTIATSFSGRQKNSPEKALELWNVPETQKNNIDFIIATLPDPVHTHLNLVFDRHIDAIEKAAQASGQGFLFSRAWMPWSSQTSPESTDFRLRAQENALREKKEDLPGILIFRREQCLDEESKEAATRDYCQKMEKAPKFLFILIVGETPTGGVHREQFQGALKMIRAVRGLPRECKKEEQKAGQNPPPPPNVEILKILGTSFSGALYSLADLLKSSDLSGFDWIEVQSGTTTDLRSIRRFREDLAKLDWGEGKQCVNRRARFVTFQESGDYGYEHLIFYLGSLGFKKKDIALLSEDETAYGRISARQTAADTSEEDHEDRSSTPKFYFPRDISQLRASYQREMSGKAAGADTKQAPRSALPLNLDVTGSDDDSVHPYANLQTPLSQEAVLKGIVSNLQKHHSKFVIVRATNVLDSLFLCQYLRAAYPDGGLIVFGADLLFQQDPDDGKLRGVLSVQTYPLLPGIDEGTVAAHEHADQVFSDSYSAGVYNATISLLSTGMDSRADELAKPWPSGSYASYAWPSLHKDVDRTVLPRRPAVWLTQMGKGGYWPIVLLDDPNIGDTHKQERSLLAAPNEPVQPGEHVHSMGVSFGLSWKILWWITFVPVGIYVWKMLKPEILPRSELGVVFSLPGEETRNACLFLAGLIFVAVVICFIFPWIYGASHTDDVIWIILPLSSLLLLGCAGYVGLVHRDSRQLGRVFLGIVLALLFIAIFEVTLGFGRQPDSSEIFFARRFTHLESGLSPVGPLYFLLAGFLWCLWFALDGIQFGDSALRLLPPGDTFLNDSALDVLQKQRLNGFSQDLTKDLFNLMRPLCPGIWAYLPAVFVLGALLFILGVQLPIVTLEKEWYRGLISFLLGIGLLLFIGLCTRLVMIWLECKMFLQRMENLKLRRSFRLGKDFEWGSLWRLASNASVLNVYQQVSREMECLVEFLQFHDEFEDGELARHWSQETWDKVGVAYGSAAKAIEKAQTDFRNAIQYFLNHLSTKAKGGEAAKGRANAEERERVASRNVIQYCRDGLRGERQRIVERVTASSEMKKLTRTFHTSMSDAIGNLLILLSLEWENEDPEQSRAENTGENADEKKKTAGKNHATCEEPPERPGLACAERCACLYLLTVALIPLRRIRSLVFGISGLYVFLLLALTSFHFEPHLTIRTGMIALFLGALGCISYVYSQIYHNKTLSRITDTPEDSLGWDFWGRMVGFVAVPVLSLLAAQFPELNHFLFSWLEPALQSFH